MDRLDAMHVLLTVVETGSLSAAGRRLGMPLPTVSRKMAELEAHLGARLLNRSTRRLDLTDAGRAYVAACRRILDEVSEAERNAAGEYNTPKGDLVITAPVAFGRMHVLPIVTAFLKAYPEVNVRLVLGDRVAHLLDEHIDVGVRIGALPDSALTASNVGRVRNVVCASPAYLKAHGLPKRPEDLAEHACITVEPLTAADGWTFRVGRKDVAVRVKARLAVSTAEAAVDAAVAGVGITRVFSYQMADARRAGALKIVLAEFEPALAPVSLVFDAQQRVALKLRAFVDLAGPALRKRLAAAG